MDKFTVDPDNYPLVALNSELVAYDDYQCSPTHPIYLPVYPIYWCPCQDELEALRWEVAELRARLQVYEKFPNFEEYSDDNTSLNACGDNSVQTYVPRPVPRVIQKFKAAQHKMTEQRRRQKERKNHERRHLFMRVCVIWIKHFSMKCVPESQWNKIRDEVDGFSLKLTQSPANTEALEGPLLDLLKPVRKMLFMEISNTPYFQEGGSSEKWLINEQAESFKCFMHFMQFIIEGFKNYDFKSRTRLGQVKELCELWHVDTTSDPELIRDLGKVMIERTYNYAKYCHQSRHL
jgi:hypothetical protein